MIKENIDNKDITEDIPEGWDQFDLNKNKFNVNNKYDEVLYTTELDREKLTEEEKIKAEKIMRVNILFYLGNSYG